MNFRKKALTYLLGAGLSLSPAHSYSSKGAVTEQEKPKEKKEITLEQKMEILGIDDPEQIEYLPGEYIATTRYAGGILRLVAGVYAGTITVKKDEKGYSGSGVYNQFMYPEKFIKTFEKADKNRDKFITEDEAINLKRKVFEKYAK